MPFKIKESILGVGIAIIFVLFVGFGIKAFYDEPKYEDFCNRGDLIDFVSSERMFAPFPKRFVDDYVDKCASARAEYDNFRKSCADKDSDLIFEFDEDGCQVATECTSCNNNFQDERNIYNRNVFIVSGIIGIIVIIVGAILHLTSVSSGLFGGGVLTIIYGTMNYWSELGDIARFIILGIALGVLIYLGYKKFGKKE